ncbi:hypothetical protein BC828DRAFT_403260 [Blastocladiella britannica]|nr:hypothetical protein BC828DRAFT_403260 [Blastocladiella britannica]
MSVTCASKIMLASNSSSSTQKPKKRPLSATSRRLATSKFVPDTKLDWLCPDTPSSTGTTRDPTLETVAIATVSPVSKPKLVSRPVSDYSSPAPDLDPTFLRQYGLVQQPSLHIFDGYHTDDAPPGIPNWPVHAEEQISGRSLLVDSANPKWPSDWEPCRVVSFDPEAGRFLIYWHGKESRKKWVYRINLCFDSWDTAHEFTARRAAAIDQQTLWSDAVYHWWQIAAVRTTAPTVFPALLAAQIVSRAKAMPQLWGASKSPTDADWAYVLQDFQSHWSFAMKQAAMDGPSILHIPDFQHGCIVATDYLPTSKTVVAWPGAWALVTQIRATLLDCIQASLPFPPAVEHGVPMGHLHAMLMGHASRLLDALQAWRKAAQSHVATIPCLGSAFTHALRLVDHLVTTILEDAIREFHARLLAECGAHVTDFTFARDAPRISIEIVLNGDVLEFDPPLQRARTLATDLAHVISRGLESWSPFSSQRTPNTENCGSITPAGATVTTPADVAAWSVPDSKPLLDLLDRAYASFEHTMTALQPATWLMTFEAAFAAIPVLESDSSGERSIEWCEQALQVSATLLARLDTCKAVLFASLHKADAFPCITLRSGTVMRTLRAHWLACHARTVQLLHSAFALESSRLAALVDHAIENLCIAGLPTKSSLWATLKAFSAREEEYAYLARGVRLARWWEICYSHGVDISDEQSATYWTAMGSERRVRWEWELAQHELQRARAEMLSRIQVANDHINFSVDAHYDELKEIAMISSSATAPATARRVAVLSVRVAKLEAEVAQFTKIQRDIAAGDEPGDLPFCDWNQVRELTGDVKRYEQLWNLTVAVQDQLAEWRKAFFTSLPREQLGATLQKWRSQIRHLAAEHEGDSSALRLLGEVFNPIAALAVQWPTLYALSSPHLAMRHWFQITKRIGLAAHDLELLMLEQVLALKLDLLADVLLVGSGPHRLVGWELWDMPMELNDGLRPTLTMEPQQLRGSRMRSFDKSASELKAAVSEPDIPQGQDALFISLRANSLHCEANPSGPPLWSAAPPTVLAGLKTSAAAQTAANTAAAARRWTVTIPYDRIAQVQARPPDARRYLSREVEWLTWNGARTLGQTTGASQAAISLEKAGKASNNSALQRGAPPASSTFLTVPAGGGAAVPATALASSITAGSSLLLPTTVTHPQPRTSADDLNAASTNGPSISTVCGNAAVRRGIWHTRHGNVFYYCAAPLDECASDPALEAQLMAQSCVSIFLTPADGEVPLTKLVLAVPRGWTPESFCESLQNASRRSIVLD